MVAEEGKAMSRWLLVLVLLVVGTATAHPVNEGWHRSDEPIDLNETTTPPQITARTVTHYYPMSELSENEITMLVTPTPRPPVAGTVRVSPVPNATFVWAVVGLSGLVGLALLLRYRGNRDGG